MDKEKLTRKVIEMVRMRVKNLTGSVTVDDTEFDVAWTGEGIVVTVTLKNPNLPTDVLRVFTSAGNRGWIDNLTDAPWVSKIIELVNTEHARLEEELANSEVNKRREAISEQQLKLNRFADIWSNKTKEEN